MNDKKYSQQELMDLLIPALKSNGLVYHKTKEVLARKAQDGEQINTITSDGLETTNTAESGSYVIKNETEAGELYIIGGAKFEERYEFLEKAENGFSRYKSIGKVIGIEMSSEFLSKMNFGKGFYFEAPWGEQMVVKEKDYLVSPLDYSEIYRIARKEFFETYDKD